MCERPASRPAMKPMRILFVNAVNPFVDAQNRYPALGLGYLIATLRREFGDRVEPMLVEEGVEETVRDWRPDLFGKSVHPALIRQWCWLAALTGSNLLLVARSAFQGTARTLRQPGALVYGVPVFALGLLWWLLVGVGYLRGRLLHRAARD